MTGSDHETCAVHRLTMNMEGAVPECRGCQDDLTRALDAVDALGPVDALLTFRTRWSLYEVDLAGRRVIRTTGERKPTARQGNDGEWREYADILAAPMPDGFSVWFDWTGEGNGTLTSAVDPDDVSRCVASLTDAAGALRALLQEP